MRPKTFVWLCLLPLAVVVLAFFVLPMLRLMIVGGSGPQGLAAYAAILTEPRYRATLINTVVLAAATTAVSLVVATIAGLFLQRTRFPGRSVLIAMLTFPLAYVLSHRANWGAHGLWWAFPISNVITAIKVNIGRFSDIRAP